MRLQRLTMAMLAVTGLTAASCATTRELQLTNNGGIPGAQSTVKVSTTDNSNTRIDLAVKHLAPPERVDPNTTVYIVWARGNTMDARAQNLGALVVDDDLNGAFSAVTPLRDFDLYVTAEPVQTAEAPTGKTLLYTTVAAR